MVSKISRMLKGFKISADYQNGTATMITISNNDNISEFSLSLDVKELLEAEDKPVYYNGSVAGFTKDAVTYAIQLMAKHNRDKTESRRYYNTSNREKDYYNSRVMDLAEKTLKLISEIYNGDYKTRFFYTDKIERYCEPESRVVNLAGLFDGYYSRAEETERFLFNIERKIDSALSKSFKFYRLTKDGITKRFCLFSNLNSNIIPSSITEEFVIDDITKIKSIEDIQIVTKNEAETELSNVAYLLNPVNDAIRTYICGRLFNTPEWENESLKFLRKADKLNAEYSEKNKREFDKQLEHYKVETGCLKGE